MSVKIAKASVNIPLEKRLRKDLYVVPKTYTSMSYGDPSPITVYRSDENYYYVPYFYYQQLIGSKVSDIEWFKKTECTFTSSLREEQEVIAKECIQHLDEHGTDLLNIFTGAGKTRLGAYMTCYYRVPTLVFISLKTLMKSWMETYEQCTSASVWMVGSKKPSQQPDVMICMIDRYNKIPQEWINEVGLLILDEGHLLVTQKRIEKLLGPTPALVLALTALVEKENGMEVALYKIIGEHRTYRANPKPITVYKVNTGITHPEVAGYQSRLDPHQFYFAQSTNVQRNRLAVDICKENNGLKGLVFCRLKSHVTELTKLLREEGLNVASMIGDAKTYIDSDVLVSTLSKTGTGFDAAFVATDYSGISFEYIILMVNIKSVSLFTQAIGRSREDECSLFYLIDNNSICQRHWKNNVKALKQRKATIVECDASMSNC